MSLVHTIFSFTTCILGTALNICEIASLLHARRTKLPFDITLISLAMSDLMLAMATLIFGIVLNSVLNMATSKEHESLYKNLFTFSIFASSLSAALHMWFIAIQRLIAVLYPFKVSIWMTRKRSIIIVLLIWVLSISVTAPVSLKYYNHQRYLMYSPLLSAVVIAVCYSIISFKMMTRKRPTVGSQQTQNLSLLLYSISFTAIFMICTFPYAIYAIKQPVHKLPIPIPEYAFHLFFLQVVFDPVIYFFLQILKKRSTICAMCCSVCHCCGFENMSSNDKM